MSVRKCRCQNRDVAIYVLYQPGVYWNRKIGKVFGLGYIVVSGAVERGLEYLGSGERLEKAVNKIIAGI